MFVLSSIVHFDIQSFLSYKSDHKSQLKDYCKLGEDFRILNVKDVGQFSKIANVQTSFTTVLVVLVSSSVSAVEGLHMHALMSTPPMPAPSMPAHAIKTKHAFCILSHRHTTQTVDRWMFCAYVLSCSA